MTERRFRCTACGQCCYGSLPLTLDEMREHCGRFPLAIVWRVVPKGARSYALTERLGVGIRFSKGRRAALSMTLASYLPPGIACPELTPDGRCGIHERKPLRCRTMPFHPAREESDQAELLRPRAGWACDTGDAAAVVYRAGRIAERADFDLERSAMLAQAETMRVHSAYVFKYMPWVMDTLAALTTNPEGSLVVSLSSFLTACRQPDAPAIAARQLPVLLRLASSTAGIDQLAEYHRSYSGWAKELSHIARASVPSDK